MSTQPIPNSGFPIKIVLAQIYHTNGFHEVAFLDRGSGGLPRLPLFSGSAIGKVN